MSDCTPISNLKNNSEESLSQEMPPPPQQLQQPPSSQQSPLGPPQNTSTAGMQYYQQMAATDSPPEEPKKEKIKLFSTEDIKTMAVLFVLFMMVNSHIFYRELYKIIPSVLDHTGKASILGNMIGGGLLAVVYLLIKKFIL